MMFKSESIRDIIEEFLVGHLKDDAPCHSGSESKEPVQRV